MRTHPVNNKLNPVFNSPHFEFLVPNEDDEIKIEIFNASQFYAHDGLGKLRVSLHMIVACPGEVQVRRDALQGGGELEYEVFYAPPERFLARDGLGRDSPVGKITPFVDLKVEHKPPQHKVPLPDFRGFGPAAFAAPPAEMEIAPVGEMKKKQEYESWACHLGQYDYEDGPVYFPEQEPVDRHAWKQDPFYRALEDADRSLAEGGSAENKDPFQKWLSRDQKNGNAGKCARCGQVMMSDAVFCRKCGHKRDSKKVKQLMDHQSNELGLWSKDPFYDWLIPESQKALPEGRSSELIQEARRERHMLALPTFHGDAKRFDDYREYADQQDLARNCRPRHNQHRYGPRGNSDRVEPNHREILWKDDPFYDWLPDHGHDTRDEHRLHRPLENARLHRLPSFSEDRFLGLQGHGIGVLKIWVKYAKNLRYDIDSHLVGRPSACVEISCRPHSDGGGRKNIDRSKRWNHMSSVEQAAWTTLGWNQHMWDHAGETGRTPDSEHKRVEDMTRAEQEAVRNLGLANSWNPRLKSSKKLTPTIEHETNPVWNTGAFQFEVQSEMDTVKFEIKDLLGRDDMSDIFLGRVETRVSELIRKLSPQYNFDAQKGTAKSLTIEETLQGTGSQGQGERGVLGFQISFQKYEGTRLALGNGASPEYQSHHSQASHAQSFDSRGDHGYIGVIKVKEIKAKDIFGHGMMDRMTHLAGSFAKAKLDTQIPQKALRTPSQTGADPVWSNLDWKFNVEPNDMYLEIAIHEEGMISDDKCVGRLVIPIYDVLQPEFCRNPRPIQDVLKDQNQQPTHGKLEVRLEPRQLA